MDMETFSANKVEAKRLWKDYVEACKKNPKDKFLQDMKKVYNQLRQGRKVVDINTVFQRSGLTFNGEPRLAIALATEKKVRCVYMMDGTVKFLNTYVQSWDTYAQKKDVVIKNIFPKIPKEKLPQFSRELTLETIVPKIPASIRPEGNLENYYVLWEVDKWELIPPRDPYLLRRINNNIFVVVAGWDLSELERAVMRGRCLVGIKMFYKFYNIEGDEIHIFDSNGKKIHTDSIEGLLLEIGFIKEDTNLRKIT